MFMALILPLLLFYSILSRCECVQRNINFKTAAKGERRPTTTTPTTRQDKTRRDQAAGLRCVYIIG